MSISFMLFPSEWPFPAKWPRGAGRWLLRIGGAGSAVASLVLAPSAAAIADSVDGDSGQDGVTITIVQWAGQDRVHAQGGGVDDGCEYGLAIGPPGYVPDLSTVGPQPVDAHLAVLTCNGVAVDLVWVGPHNTVDLADAARAAARRWVQTVPVPRPVLRSSPPRAGLVGLESWFWLEGGPGGPIAGRVEAFGVAVDVRIVPAPVAWSFGDGTAVTAGPGRAWPARSDVRHAYQHGGRPTVTTGQRLEPAYRVLSGEWLALPPILVEATLDHPVLEAQAIVTG